MLNILYFVILSYLVIAADAGRCKPDYLFNYNACGWLKLHVIPATWEEAFLRCRHEGDSFEDVFNEWNNGQPNNLGGIQDRVSFIREGALDDIDPEFNAMFVCEKSPTSIQYEVPLLEREELLGMQEDAFKKLNC